MGARRTQVGIGSVGIFLFAFFSAASSYAGVDWAKPPVACVEDLLPKMIPCLDLSGVANPQTDLPADLDEDQIRYWSVTHRPDLNVCRGAEIQRRERIVPGSQTASALLWAWMWVKQAENLDLKVTALYEAAERAEIPPQILFGALKQESLLSDLGISDDGGNFSCGIGQINLIEWCHFMGTRPGVEQSRLGWPVGVSCSPTVVPTELVRPFYDIALRRIGGRPSYELTPRDFAEIPLRDVVSRFPDATDEIQNVRFQAVTSFVRNCSDLSLGIAAKGKELRRLYDTYVPAAMRTAQVYAPGKTFTRKCRRPYRSPVYPLHTGWLLADAIYNAGSREVTLLQHYYRMTPAVHEAGKVWKKMTPLDLIEGLHWGGKYNPASDKIEYTGSYGTKNSQSWFKSCVVQRHIARVIQYATLPGFEIAKSLEIGGCSRTEVPEYRRKSSGKKAMQKPVP